MRKHYRDQLDLGHVKANAQVAGFLFTAAKKGNVPAMMFWLKCRAGWVGCFAAAAAAIGKKEAARCCSAAAGCEFAVWPGDCGAGRAKCGI